MKLIPLTQGKFAKVDDEDFEWLSQWKWKYDHGYAMRQEGGRFHRRNVYMHRRIMNTPEGMDTDHINCDKLDNRRKNLRVCEHFQNNANGRKRSNNTSGYIGVSWDKRKGMWVARIVVKTKQMVLGYFENPKEAALVRDDAALKYFGEYARTNF